VVVYPALMLLFDRRERGEADAAEMARAMEYIESFLVRGTICRVPPNNLNRIFQAVPAQFPQGVPVADGLHQLLSAENRFRPDDDELRTKVREAPFYRTASRISAGVCCNAFALAQLTIEHGMPQSPGQERMRVLEEEGENSAAGSATAPERSRPAPS
jgi:hypothetical protein